MSRLELLPSAGQMYIYKLGTECDGAQTRASDVYVPTLVALLGLCFDPSECFRDLHIWSRVVGNKSGKLRYVSRIVTNWNARLELILDQSPLLRFQTIPLQTSSANYSQKIPLNIQSCLARVMIS